MSSADRSQTERIRRLRAQIQAVRRAECAACPELGPQGPTDQSTWLSRRFGQTEYIRLTPAGAPVVQSCCLPSSAPQSCCIGTANFTEYNTNIAPLFSTPTSDFTVVESTCDLMTWSYILGINPVTVSNTVIVFVQNNFSFNVDGSLLNSIIYINNSTNPVQATATGQSVTFTLQPCGAVVANPN